MSTKIYYAYKIPTSKMLDSIKLIKKLQWDKGVEKIKLLNSIVKPEIVDELRSYLPEESDDKLRLYIILYYIKQNSKKLTRSYFDIESGLKGWVYNDYFYFMLWGEFVNLKLPDYIEDFHYQNQCDKPEEISDKEWDHRCEVWNYLIDNYEDVYLYMSSINFDHYMTESNLYRSIFDKPHDYSFSSTMIDVHLEKKGIILKKSINASMVELEYT